MQRPVRKNIRIQSYNYNTPGYYFITICTRNKEKILSNIVGTGLPDGPLVKLTECGSFVKDQLDNMSCFYEDLILEKYVVMPNHIHLLLHITGHFESTETISPTNVKVSKFVGTFKRFTNRKVGRNIWQSRSHDHVIRGEADYQKIWMYIETNPARWEKDCFYYG